MHTATLVTIIDGRRYVARPRDHRQANTCHGCSLAFIPPRHRHCPRDAGGNLVCRLGHGWIWRRIPRRQAARVEPEADPRQGMLSLI